MSLPFGATIPFVDHLGVTLEKFEDGQSILHFTPQVHHQNSFGVTHGGAVMTLLDVAMAHAARSRNLSLPDGGPGLVTIEMKTSFMRPGQGRIRVIGQVLQGTISLAFTEGRVLDEQGRLCAHATATFKFLRALPVGDRQVNALAAVRSGPGSD